MKKAILQLSLILLSTSLFAQTTVENFSYGAITGTAADTLTNPSFGGSVWRRHSGSTGQITYLGTSLTYAGYPSSGIGGSVGFSFAATTGQDINRSTTNYTSGNVFISFLLSVSASGSITTNDSYFFHLMDTSATTAHRARLHIRAGTVANTFRIGLGKFSTSTPDSSINYPINTPVLVVLKYGFYPGALNDSVTAYVFTSGVPVTEPAMPTLRTPAADMANGSASDLAVLNGIAIRQHSGGIVGIIDGIRVSDSWASSPLPVELTSFNAKIVNDNSTLLSWTTSSEYDNMGFEIERSVDGKEFETIGFVKGAGKSNKVLYYSFDYANTESAFYRLKQIDFDGKFSYSNIVVVKADEFKTRFTPNPFDNQIEISSEGTINRIEIIDMMGKVVLNEVINKTIANINSSNIVNGVYFIKIYQGETVVTKRIVKAN